MSDAKNAEAVFLAALEKATPRERAAYVEGACANDAGLLSRVRELLTAHDQTQGPFDVPPPGLAVAGAADAAMTGEVAGALIGPYKLIEQIGEGGMGTVWMAQQTEPVKRLVAIKLIKAGMDTKQIIVRFEAERQALALMDHPNIAKVLDAGTTGEPVRASGRVADADATRPPTRLGSPYFVMELVKGVPITKYCDEHHLTPRQRLELFIPVCQASLRRRSAVRDGTMFALPRCMKRRRASRSHPSTIPIAAAKSAGLKYVTDKTPGIRRQRRGDGFIYLRPDGTRVPRGAEIQRIRSLAIPPAWTDVWICPDPDGHLQATGRDARGRKQHRYHPRWREVRDDAKYHRMIAFAQALPRLRARLERQLRRPGLPRDKVLAAVVRLLETTLIRVGNEEYAKQNNSFGLTTMRDGHAQINGAAVCFSFRGKSGIEHRVDLQDKRLARIVKACQELPGQELFQYLDDDGAQRTVTSSDVNEHLRSISGADFTAKDFRTWAGTVLAARALQEFRAFDTQAQAKKQIVAAIEKVAKRLGNTKAVCRKCYIHPAVLDAYLDGSLLKTLTRRAEKEMTRSLHKLQPEEAAVLALLQQRLNREAAAS
jgi:DNA topoisomerase I